MSPPPPKKQLKRLDPVPLSSWYKSATTDVTKNNWLYPANAGRSLSLLISMPNDFQSLTNVLLLTKDSSGWAGSMFASFLAWITISPKTATHLSKPTCCKMKLKKKNKVTRCCMNFYIHVVPNMRVRVVLHDTTRRLDNSYGLWGAGWVDKSV